MTGQHEAPPIASAAREATAPPYIGHHRDDRYCLWCRSPATRQPLTYGWDGWRCSDQTACLNRWKEGQR